MRAGIVSEDGCFLERFPRTKVPGMVQQGGAAGVFVSGASGSFRTFWGWISDFFLVNHTEEIEVGSVPSGPNVGVCRAFWEREGIVLYCIH